METNEELPRETNINNCTTKNITFLVTGLAIGCLVTFIGYTVYKETRIPSQPIVDIQNSGEERDSDNVEILSPKVENLERNESVSENTVTPSSTTQLPALTQPSSDSLSDSELLAPSTTPEGVKAFIEHGGIRVGMFYPDSVVIHKVPKSKSETYYEIADKLNPNSENIVGITIGDPNFYLKSFGDEDVIYDSITKNFFYINPWEGTIRPYVDPKIFGYTISGEPMFKFQNGDAGCWSEQYVTFSPWLSDYRHYIQVKVNVSACETTEELTQTRLKFEQVIDEMLQSFELTPAPSRG